VEQYPVTEGHARQASEHASRGRNRAQGIALWGVLGGRRLRLDYTVVSLATAFHGNLAPLTLLLTTSPKDAQAADKEIVSSRIYASHNLLRSDDFLYWIACLKRWLHE
jgi:hypothetical protein